MDGAERTRNRSAHRDTLNIELNRLVSKTRHRQTWASAGRAKKEQHTRSRSSHRWSHIRTLRRACDTMTTCPNSSSARWPRTITTKSAGAGRHRCRLSWARYHTRACHRPRHHLRARPRQTCAPPWVGGRTLLICNLRQFRAWPSLCFRVPSVAGYTNRSATPPRSWPRIAGFPAPDSLRSVTAPERRAVQDALRALERR